MKNLWLTLAVSIAMLKLRFRIKSHRQAPTQTQPSVRQVKPKKDAASGASKVKKPEQCRSGFRVYFQV